MVNPKRLFYKHLGIVPPTEPEVWKRVKKIHGTSFIDVGANRGLVYTFRLCRNFYRTYAIEPNPRLAELLRQKARIRGLMDGWGGVEVNEWAASDENGSVELLIDLSEEAGATTIDPSHSQRYKLKTSSLKVPTRSLDDWWGEGPIDLLKIDVENAEFKVLAGSKRILGLTRNIVVELHSNRRTELEDLLRARFTKVAWVDENHVFARR